MKTYMVVALCLTLLACGGAPANLPTTSQTTKLVVIGNSITQHGPNEALGWSGNWGMAASSADKDFAHLTATKLGTSLYVTHFADLERTPGTATALIPGIASNVTPTTLVVIELGDNVPSDGLAAFAPAYEQLLQAVQVGQRVVCVSTFWHNTATDDLIKSACTAHGAHYAYIGDIYSDPANPDLQSTAFVDPFVNMHPHDWGMARISERVIAQSR